jgi:hypothetical protein
MAKPPHRSFVQTGNLDAKAVQTEFAASLSLSMGGAGGDLSIKILFGTRTGNSSLIAGVLLRLAKNKESLLVRLASVCPPPFACVSIRRVDLKRLGVTLTLESGLGVLPVLRPRALRADPGTKAEFSTFSF